MKDEGGGAVVRRCTPSQLAIMCHEWSVVVRRVPVTVTASLFFPCLSGFRFCSVYIATVPSCTLYGALIGAF